MVENAKEKKIKVLRSDHEGEFLSNKFKTFYENHGIKKQLTTTHMLHQNGVAKRKNHTILDRAQTMAIDNGVPDYLWTKTVNTITYLTYRNPSRSNNGFFPEHVYTRVLPNLKHLKVFGYLVYVHVGKKQEGKMGSKSIRCIFAGYNKASKAYHCF